jgi:hypothetical protein
MARLHDLVNWHSSGFHPSREIDVSCLFRDINQTAAIGYCSSDFAPVTTTFDYRLSSLSFGGAQSGQLCWHKKGVCRMERHDRTRDFGSSSASPYFAKYHLQPQITDPLDLWCSAASPSPITGLTVDMLRSSRVHTLNWPWMESSGTCGSQACPRHVWLGACALRKHNSRFTMTRLASGVLPTHLSSAERVFIDMQ